MRPTKETGILTVAAVREPRDKGRDRGALQRAAADLRAAGARRPRSPAACGRRSTAARPSRPCSTPAAARSRESSRSRSASCASSRRSASCSTNAGAAVQGRPRADRPDDVQHRRPLPEGSDLQALHEDHPELQGREGHLRLLRGAVVPSARAVRDLALHPVPVRARRLLRAGAQDAPDHHRPVRLLLREGLQLRQPRTPTGSR